nr:MAG TPA: hypothetical protein [Caudoviricetes sp.]
MKLIFYISAFYIIVISLSEFSKISSFNFLSLFLRYLSYFLDFCLCTLSPPLIFYKFFRLKTSKY